MKSIIFFSLFSGAALGAIDLPPMDNSPSHWINTPTAAPVLKSGKSTLLFVFTRDCGNCHRSHGVINALQKKYGAKVQFVGVHSPEFAWEKDPVKLAAYAAKMVIRYPIYLDADMKVWQALENRYWPAFFLFDASGRHVETFIGETHAGDGNAQKIEARLAGL